MSMKALEGAARQLQKIGEKGSFLLINKDSTFKFSGCLSLDEMISYKEGLEALIEYRKKRIAQLGKTQKDRVTFANEAAGEIYSSPEVSNVVSLLEGLLTQLQVKASFNASRENDDEE